MVFEHEPGRQTVVDLSGEAQKGKARTFIQGFQEQSRHDMGLKIGELALA